MHDPTTALRLRLARLIMSNGPTSGEELTAALEVTAEQFWASVCCPWFDISGRGWVLTARGEREAIFPALEETAST
jgi:hypothetical protein